MVLELIRSIVALDPARREQGADTVTDLISSYSSTEARVLAGVLAVSAAVEQDLAALESELHAVLEIGSTGVLQSADVSPLRELDTDTLPEALAGYVSDILSET